MGSFDGDLAKAQLQLGAPCRPAATLDHVEAAAIGDGEGCHRRIERAAADQGAVLHGSRQQMELGLGDLGPSAVDVAFAIADHRHHRGCRQDLLGGQRRRQPAPQFSLARCALVVGDHLAALSGPYLAGHQAQAVAALTVDRQHGVQQHAIAVAPGDLAQPPAVVRRGAEVDLASIVDRQHVPASGGSRRLLAPALEQAGQRHLRIIQEPAIAHDLRPLALGRSTKAHALARDHARQQQRPPFSRRRSPNLPKLNSIPAPLITRRAVQPITSPADSSNKIYHRESIRRTMCASPRAKLGRRVWSSTTWLVSA